MKRSERIAAFVEASRARGFVIVNELDILNDIPFMRVFLHLETAGIDVVPEPEPDYAERSPDDGFNVYLAQIATAQPRFTAHHEKALMERLRQGDAAVGIELMEPLLRMAAMTAIAYPRTGQHRLVRVQQANELLLGALKLFQGWRRAYRFSSYAIWAVRRGLIATGV